MLVLLLATFCRASEEEQNSILPDPSITNAQFSFEFDKGSSFRDVMAGGRVKLRVLMRSIEPVDYVLVSADNDPNNSEVAFGKTLASSIPAPTALAGWVVKAFSVRIDIQNIQQPRNYSVLLTFKKADGATFPARFDLPVGVKDPAEGEGETKYVKVTPPKEVVVEAGMRGFLALKIENKYPEFDVRVYGWDIFCADGLVSQQTFNKKAAKDPALIIPHGETEDLRIPIEGETMSALTNLQAQPKLTVILYYDDTHRAMQNVSPDISVDFRLRFGPLIRLLCALAGGLFGVWLRGFLPKGYTPLPGKKKLGLVARYGTGLVLATLGWILSLGLGIEVLALGGRSLASHATPFGSLILGLAFGVLSPTKVAQFVERLFSKSMDPKGESK